jgi:hypothetical protein
MIALGVTGASEVWGKLQASGQGTAATKLFCINTTKPQSRPSTPLTSLHASSIK